VSGKTDDYKDRQEVTTTAMAEGAIEGSANEYTVSGPFDTGFKYSRFARVASDECAPRDVSKLNVAKAPAAKDNVKGVFTTEKVDTEAISTDSVLKQD